MLADDIKFMRRSLELAELAKGRTSPNPMVGAVIVKDGKIVGEGYHKKAGMPHAEIDALKNANLDTQNATMYVSLEPCCHWGRTPPCTKSIIESKISRVVMAMIDPNPKVCGNGKHQLESHGMAVECGLLEREAKRLNEAYIKYITSGLPFVILKVAMSLDGKIATAKGESKWITSESCRLKAHKLRDESDAILVGLRTIIQDDPSLTTRLPKNRGQGSGVRGQGKDGNSSNSSKVEGEWEPKDPIRVVVDSQARIPLEAKVLNPCRDAPPCVSTSVTIVAVTDRAPLERIEALKSCGAEVIILPDKDGKVDLKTLMSELGKRDLSTVLIEGGGELNASALEMGLVDKVVFFIAPKLIGGKSAPTPIDGKGIQNLSAAVKLQDLTIERIGDEIVVEGYVHKELPTLPTLSTLKKTQKLMRR